MELRAQDMENGGAAGGVGPAKGANLADGGTKAPPTLSRFPRER